MKKWNAPEVVELDITCTAGGKGNGNTPDASDVNYKAKNQQCECNHNTNFAFQSWCNGDHSNGSSGTPDGNELSA